jgi:plasmid replication initiation protein
MKNVSDKVVEEIKTHTALTITFFRQKKRGVYDIMWKNIV